LSYLAKRLSDSLMFETENNTFSLSSSDFREKYIDSLIFKLFGKNIDNFFNSKNNFILFNQDILDEYKSRLSTEQNDLLNSVLPLKVVNKARGYGILSIYFEQTPARKMVSDLLERHIGRPQYRLDSDIGMKPSPMSLTTIEQQGNMFFWMSYSSSYDFSSDNIPNDTSKPHTLTIEGLDNPSCNLRVTQDTEANEAWKSHRVDSIIRKTRLPYSSQIEFPKEFYKMIK
jgi:hypothetical protein